MPVYLFIDIYFSNFPIFLFMYWSRSVTKSTCVIIRLLGLYWYPSNGVSKPCESMSSFHVCIRESSAIVGVGYANMEFSVWVDHVDILRRELLTAAASSTEPREATLTCSSIDGLCLLWLWIADFRWISSNFQAQPNDYQLFSQANHRPCVRLHSIFDTWPWGSF